jgi:hypothetical protein
MLGALAMGSCVWLQWVACATQLFFRRPLAHVLLGFTGAPGSDFVARSNAVVLTVAVLVVTGWTGSYVWVCLLIFLDLVAVSVFSGTLLVTFCLRIEWHGFGSLIDAERRGGFLNLMEKASGAVDSDLDAGMWQLLLYRAVDVNICNGDGFSLVQIASLLGLDRSVEPLTKLKFCNVGAVSTCGTTALLMAVQAAVACDRRADTLQAIHQTELLRLRGLVGNLGQWGPDWRLNQEIFLGGRGLQINQRRGLSSRYELTIGHLVRWAATVSCDRAQSFLNQTSILREDFVRAHLADNPFADETVDADGRVRVGDTFFAGTALMHIVQAKNIGLLICFLEPCVVMAGYGPYWNIRTHHRLDRLAGQSDRLAGQKAQLRTIVDCTSPLHGGKHALSIATSSGWILGSVLLINVGSSMHLVDRNGNSVLANALLASNQDTQPGTTRGSSLLREESECAECAEPRARSSAIRRVWGQLAASSSGVALTWGRNVLLPLIDAQASDPSKLASMRVFPQAKSERSCLATDSPNADTECSRHVVTYAALRHYPCSLIAILQGMAPLETSMADSASLALLIDGESVPDMYMFAHTDPDKVDIHFGRVHSLPLDRPSTTPLCQLIFLSAFKDLLDPPSDMEASSSSYFRTEHVDTVALQLKWAHEVGIFGEDKFARTNWPGTDTSNTDPQTLLACPSESMVSLPLTGMEQKVVDTLALVAAAGRPWWAEDLRSVLDADAFMANWAGVEPWSTDSAKRQQLRVALLMVALQLHIIHCIEDLKSHGVNLDLRALGDDEITSSELNMELAEDRTKAHSRLQILKQAILRVQPTLDTSGHGSHSGQHMVGDGSPDLSMSDGQSDSDWSESDNDESVAGADDDACDDQQSKRDNQRLLEAQIHIELLQQCVHSSMQITRGKPNALAELFSAIGSEPPVDVLRRCLSIVADRCADRLSVCRTFLDKVPHSTFQAPSWTYLRRNICPVDSAYAPAVVSVLERAECVPQALCVLTHLLAFFERVAAVDTHDPSQLAQVAARAIAHHQPHRDDDEGPDERFRNTTEGDCDNWRRWDGGVISILASLAKATKSQPDTRAATPERYRNTSELVRANNQQLERLHQQLKSCINGAKVRLTHLDTNDRTARRRAREVRRRLLGPRSAFGLCVASAVESLLALTLDTDSFKPPSPQHDQQHDSTPSTPTEDDSGLALRHSTSISSTPSPRANDLNSTRLRRARSELPVRASEVQHDPLASQSTRKRPSPREGGRPEVEVPWRHRARNLCLEAAPLWAAMLSSADDTTDASTSTARQRTLHALDGGCLSFLQHCPHAVDLGTRQRLIAQHIGQLLREQYGLRFGGPPRQIRVTRKRILEWSLPQLMLCHPYRLGRIEVHFVNERGQDAGGLTSEWFTLVGESLLQPVNTAALKEALSRERSNADETDSDESVFEMLMSDDGDSVTSTSPPPSSDDDSRDGSLDGDSDGAELAELVGHLRGGRISDASPVRVGDVVEFLDHVGQWNAARIMCRLDNRRVLVYLEGRDPEDWILWLDITRDRERLRLPSAPALVGPLGELREEDFREAQQTFVGQLMMDEGHSVWSAGWLEALHTVEQLPALYTSREAGSTRPGGRRQRPVTALRVSVASLNSWFTHQTQPQDFVPLSSLNTTRHWPPLRLVQWLEAVEREPQPEFELEPESEPEPESESESALVGTMSAAGYTAALISPLNLTSSAEIQRSGVAQLGTPDDDVVSGSLSTAATDAPLATLPRTMRLFSSSDTDPAYPISLYEIEPELRDTFVQAFEFVGSFVGLCIWKKQTIRVRFAKPFLQQVLGAHVSIADYRTINAARNRTQLQVWRSFVSRATLAGTAHDCFVHG